MGQWRALDDPLEEASERLLEALQLVNGLRIAVALAQHSAAPLTRLCDEELKPVSDLLVRAHEQIAIRVPRTGNSL